MNESQYSKSVGLSMDTFSMNFGFIFCLKKSPNNKWIKNNLSNCFGHACIQANRHYMDFLIELT